MLISVYNHEMAPLTYTKYYTLRLAWCRLLGARGFVPWSFRNAAFRTQRLTPSLKRYLRLGL